ncbi:hypothetical protein OG455_18795 [Kitasatospora sp. NBC_01287]|uniref:hypothetical protein n=1 Tax=Kitasatospora sp. NBC_01287 TaxID=2903573 RepID=UPI002254FF16|nr:hypothetical protein [Kitasatospora sp. NBC_01287]MCX4747541.1 hypothetical protein [Kitasatospora sp. NBC_01287]
MRFHLWGGGGGNSAGSTGVGFGGGGGYTQGTVSAPVASSYSINVPAGGGGAFNAGTGGGAAWVKDASGALLLVAGGGGGGGRGIAAVAGGNGGAGGGANGANGSDGGGAAAAKGGAGATGAVGGAAGSAGTLSGKAGTAQPTGAGGAGGTDGNIATSNAGGGGGAGYAGGAGGDAGIVTQSGAGGGGGSGFVDTGKVPDGTTTAGAGQTAGGTDDPFYDSDKYGAPKTGGAVVVEWSITPVDIVSAKNGDTIGTSTEFSGTGLPKSTVTLTRGTTTVGTATVAADGTWTILASGQSTGTNVVYTATQTSTGNQPVTDSVSVTVVATGTITGKPVTQIQTSPTGACQAFFNSVAQFYGSPQSCATAISTGSSLWAGAFFNSATAPSAVSQTPTTGSGTSADPFTMTTVFSVGSGALRLSQTETYVNGENGFRVDITVTNRSASAQAGNLYRGGDCLLAGVDRSFGAVLPAAPGMGNGIACVQKVDGTGQAMLLVPLTAGSSYAEGALSKVRDPASTGKPLPNTCDCTTELDSGMGISWPYSLAPGTSKTYSLYSGFRPDKVAALTSSKTVTPGKVQPGETVTYTVSFSNPNTFPMNTFGFTDTLDPRLDYVPGSTSGSGTSSGLHEPTVTGSKVAWGGFFTLAKGPDPGKTPDPASVFTFTFQAKVKDTATLGTATNDFSGDGIAPLSQVAPVLIAPLADLTVTKSVDKPSVLTGGQAVFTLTARNDGPNAAANVVLTDKLPTGLTYVSDDSGGKYDKTAGTWTVGALAKGATATLKITVKGTTEGDYVNAVTALTSDTTNTKPLCADATDPSTCPNAKLSVRSSDLVMTAATAPNPVAPGGTSVATLTVTNNGPSTTASPATVTFTLPQRTTPGSPLPAGCVAAADGKSVTCTVPAGLAKGAKTDLPVPLVVASNAPLATALTGGSVVVASADDLNTANNTAAVPLSTTARASNDLAMSVTAPTAPVIPGTTTTVTGTVTNGGPSDTTSVSAVTFTLPGSTTAAATQPSGCTVAADKKSVTCTIPAGLKNGAAASFAISVVVDSAAPLGATLSGGSAAVVNSEDPLATNNVVNFQLTTTAAASADLSITKKAEGTGSVVPGGNLVYDIVVANAGPSQATNVIVTDALPVALNFVSSDSGCTASGQTVTCGPVATLNAGATKTIRLTVQLDSAYSGDGSDIRNQASVKSDAADPNMANNTSDASTGGLPGPGPGPNPPLKASADLSIAKKAEGTTAVAPGQSFVYDLTVTNGGLSQAKNVTVTDVLPAGLLFQPSAGCTASGQTVTCGPLATLDAGQAQVFKVAVQLDPAYAGDGSDIRNQASVKSDTADPNMANNTSDASTGGLPGPGPGPNPPAKPSADLSIIKKAEGTTAVAPGQTFIYDITVTNGGPSQAKNVTVTDALPAGLIFQPSAGCSASGRTVTCGPAATLGVGKTQVFKVTVQLDPAYAGDGSDIRNQASVKSDTADPDTSNNTSDASTGGLPGPGPGPNPPLKPSADLSITKKAEGATAVAPGQSFVYDLTVANGGPSQAKNVVVTDTLQKELKFVSSADGCTAADQIVTCGPLATLDAGKTQVYRITVLLDPAYAGDGSDIRNQASVKSDTADPDRSNNTSDASTGGLPGPGPGPNPPLRPSADLSVTKKAEGTSSVAPGQSFVYDVTVANGGPSQAKNVTVTDVLPAGLIFQPSAGCTASGQTVTCGPLATLDAGQAQVFKVTVQLDQAYAGDGSDIRNQASVKSDTADPNMANNTSDAATGGLPGPNPGPNPPLKPSADLSITKKAEGTSSVAPGQSFVYDLTVTNGGLSQAKNVTVTDVLPAGLLFQPSAGCSASGQTVTCGPLATLNVGQAQVFKVAVQLDPAYAGDGSDIRNQASVKSDTADPDLSNNTSDASTGGLPGPGPGPNPPLKPSADLSITKKAEGTSSVAPGQSFVYDVTVANAGPSQAKNVTVTDALPAGLLFQPSAGCTASDQTVTCGPAATLDAGQAQVFKVAVQLDPAYAGDGSDIKNQASVKSDTADPNMANNTSDAATGGLPGPGPGPNPPLKPSADLSITKKAEGTSSVAPGQTFVYDVTVANAGPSQAKNVVVTDALPAALKFVSSDAGCTAAAQSVTCGPIATVNVGATSTIRLTVQLDPAYSGDGSDIRNQASVKSDTADPSTANNTSDASTGGLPGPNPGPNPPLKPSADLSITKKAEGTTAVAPGQSFSYDITVTNGGLSQAKNVTVTDVLPAGLLFQPSAGCSASGQTVTCGPLATLDVGQAQVFKVTVQLDQAYAGDGSDIRNQASVKSDTADPDLVNNTSDATTGGLPGPGPGPNPPAPAKADLGITKAPVGTTAVAPGEMFEYQLTVANTGPSQAKNVVVTDTLQKELKFVSSTDGCAVAGQVVTCTGPAALDSAATKTYKIKVQLDPAYAGDGSDIRNQASVKSDTADPNMANNTSDASTGGLPGPGPGPNPPLKPSADLSVAKKAEGATGIAPGQMFVYDVTVANAGPSQAKNVVVTDVLPAALKFVSSDAGCTAAAQSVTCGPIATVNVGAMSIIRLTVQLDPAYAGDGSDIRNQASVKSDTADPDLSNNTSDASTGGLPGPNPGPNPPLKPSADLSITKKAEGTTAVAPGQSFVYDITVTNGGLSQAKNVTVTDVLPAGLIFQPSAGCTASGQTVTCGPATTLDVGQARVFKVTVQLDPAYAGDGSDIRNQASVKSDTADPDLSNNTSDASTGGLPGPGPGPNPPLKPSADLSITKKAEGTTAVAPGQSFVYDVTVANAGPSQAKNVTVTDVLPAGLIFQPSAGCTASGQTVTCGPAAALDVGQTQVFKLTVQLDPAYAGDGSDIRNQASARSDTADPNMANNTSDASTGGLPGPGPGPNPPLKPSADLSITKKAEGTGSVVPGGTLVYDITVANAGPSQAKNVVVTDVLPAALKFVSSDAGCTAAAQSVTCGPIATVNVGATSTIRLAVQLDPAYSGDGSDIRNQASVKSDTADPDTANNTSDASTGGLPGPGPGPNPPLKPSADLSITKKAEGTTAVAPGQTFVYDITVTNGGLSQAKNVTVTDVLPAGLIFQPSANCSASGQTVTCGPLATLDVGQAQVFKVTVQLDPAYAGDGSDIRNQASVKSDTADPDLSNNTSDASTGGLPGPGPGPNPPLKPSADLSITKKAEGATAVAPGQTFVYDITLSNAGPSQAKNVTVTDVLPAGLIFQPSANCSASGQTVTCGPAATLDVGQAQVFKVTVQLDPAYAGDGSDIRNQASVKSDTTDPNTANNTSDASTGGLPGPGPGPNPPLKPSADLAITKKPASTVPVPPGGTFDYAITVTNSGPSLAKAVVMTDTLPAHLSFVSASDGCTASGQAVTCPALPTLAAQATHVYTVKVMLDPDYTGDGSDIRNQASVQSDTADPDLSNNISDASTGGLPGPNPGPNPAPNPPAPPSADLAITKKAVGTAPVAPGGEFEYEVVVTNNGPSPAKNVNVTDNLPSALTFVSGAGCASQDSKTVTCGPVVSLAPKATQAYRIKVMLDPHYTGDGSDIRNQASVKSDTADPDLSNNTSDASTGGLPGPGPGPNPPTPPSADLAITKAPEGTTAVPPGGTFTYDLTVTDHGPSPAKNVRVTDALPQALKFVSSPDGCAASGQNVSCGPVGEMLNAAVTVFRIVVQLDPAYAGDGSEIKNTASVTNDVADPDPSNNTSDASTGHLPGPGPGPFPPAKPSADLAITKAPVGTTAVSPGETFDYELAVTNNGPSVARNVVVTDALQNALVLVSSPDGCTAAGQRVTCPTVPVIAAKETKKFTIKVRLDPAYSGDGSDIRNQASVTSDTADPDLSNNTSDASTGHLPGPTPPGPVPPTPGPKKADLAITKKPVGTAPVAPGTDFDYAVTVTDNGPSQAANVVVTDMLPAPLAFVSSPDGCTAAGTPYSGSEKVTCPTLATLEVKGQKTFTIRVKLADVYSGDGSDIRNQASVTSDTADPDLSNNTSNASTGGLPGPNPGPNPPAKPFADLALTKTGIGTGAKVPPGGTFVYDLKVTNNGPSTARNAVVADLLPKQLRYVSSDLAACTASGVPYSGQEKVTCSLGDLGNGAVEELRITVRIDPAFRPAGSGQAPEIVNTATVASDSADPNQANNSASASGVPGGIDEPVTDLAVTKEFDPKTPGPVSPGETYSYLITITNLGPSEAARSYRVVDTLPAGLAVVGYTNADTGRQLDCAVNGLVRDCLVGDRLAVGQKVVTRMTVRLGPDYAGDGSDIANSVVVSAGDADPNERNNTDSVTGLPDPACEDPKASPAAPGCPGKPGKPKSTLVVSTDNQHDEKYPGEIRQLAFEVINLGPSTLRDPAVLTVRVPDHLRGPNEQLPPECTANQENTLITCRIPAGLKPQGKYSTGELRFPVDPLALGGETVTGTETVSYQGPEGQAQATGNWTTYIKPRQAGLVVTKTAVPPVNGGPVSVSNPFDYVITVTNKGPSAARNVFVTDPLPKALVFAGSATGCRAAGQVVTCPVHDPLLSGATVTERISAKLSPSYRGDGTDIFNTATVHSDTPNPLPDTNPDGTGGLDGIKVITEIPLPDTGAGDLPVELGWAVLLTGVGAGTYVVVRRRRRRA